MRKVLILFIALAWSGITDAGDLSKTPPPAQITADKSDWWSFKPALRPAVPQVKTKKWARNPIDLFILARLKEQNLSPSPEADRRTLIRRLSFDLTGLPPSAEEVEQFVRDRSSTAYEKLVDRLLASPRYGERWARHWLDTVHYADTHGYDKDKPRPNAWRYRDYVIGSLNQDKPYSRVVQEQLAGDVLFPEEPEGVVALGFIAAGPWDFVGHVELPIEKTDGLIARYNDRDDMVMTTMSTFESLTVHCARCHDHKFDPIRQKDYYGLQAVFAGVDRADRAFDWDKKVYAKRRALAQKKKPIEERHYAVTNEIGRLSNSELAELDGQRKALRMQLAEMGIDIALEKSPGDGYRSEAAKTADSVKWVQVDLGNPLPVDEIRLVPTFPMDTSDSPGFGFPVRFRVETSLEPGFVAAEMLADHTAADFIHRGDGTVSIPGKGRTARYVRVTATRLWQGVRDYVFALAEIQAMVSGTNAAFGTEVISLDSFEGGYWSKRSLVDGFDSRSRLPNYPATEKSRSKEILEAELKALKEKRKELVDALTSEALCDELAAVTSLLDEINREISALPPPEKVYAAANDFPSDSEFLPAKSPRPVHLLGRGDVRRPGELMEAAAIPAVPGPAAQFKISDADNEGLRRAALARWITDPANSLTRRSIVNRIWHYHFGRGIVETPNDFGHMGGLPSHPELLDWLAFWFLDNGESLKKLHRLIVTSATYRQSSNPRAIGSRTNRTNRTVRTASPHPDASASEKDADNHYLWRMNRSRLDAESIRDAMLFISGKLDLTMGGPGVQQFYFKEDHSPIYDYTLFDVDSPASYRRSIYRFIVRSVPDPLMESLDCPDASILTPKRSTTMTSLQALSILNDPFALKQSEHFAERVAKAGSVRKQIEQVYRLALNRRPTGAELKKLRPFAQKYGMSNLCRLIFNSSEFMFVD